MSGLLLEDNTGDTTGSPIAYNTGWSQPLIAPQTDVDAAIDYARVKIYALAGDGWGTVNARVVINGAEVISEGSIPHSSLPVGSPGDWVTIPLSAGDISVNDYVRLQLQQEAEEDEWGGLPSAVFWRRKPAQYYYMWELWGTLYLPGKPTNPTPAHEATSQRLSLASLTWESGS